MTSPLSRRPGALQRVDQIRQPVHPEGDSPLGRDALVPTAVGIGPDPDVTDMVALEGVENDADFLAGVLLDRGNAARRHQPALPISASSAPVRAVASDKRKHAMRSEERRGGKGWVSTGKY